jgi:hypothetical protein
MQLKGNEVQVTRRVVRFLIVVAVSVLIIGTALVFSLAIALASGNRGRRSHPELIVATALAIVYALWRKRDAGWHACGQCGVPIEPPSRAEYCSPSCRRYARLQREAFDRRAETLASYGEVPF